MYYISFKTKRKFVTANFASVNVFGTIDHEIQLQNFTKFAIK